MEIVPETTNSSLIKKNLKNEVKETLQSCLSENDEKDKIQETPLLLSEEKEKDVMEEVQDITSSPLSKENLKSETKETSQSCLPEKSGEDGKEKINETDMLSSEEKVPKEDTKKESEETSSTSLIKESLKDEAKETSLPTLLEKHVKRDPKKDTSIISSEERYTCGNAEAGDRNKITETIPSVSSENGFEDKPNQISLSSHTEKYAKEIPPLSSKEKDTKAIDKDEYVKKMATETNQSLINEKTVKDVANEVSLTKMDVTDKSKETTLLSSEKKDAKTNTKGDEGANVSADKRSSLIKEDGLNERLPLFLKKKEVKTKTKQISKLSSDRKSVV